MTKNDEAGTLYDALRALPLIDGDMFLLFQAFNLGVVDSMLRDWEKQLVSEYLEKEHTPTSSAISVGAMSQLWVFGIYELLRTWRQRANRLLDFVDGLSALDADAKSRRIEERKASIRAASFDPEHADPSHLVAIDTATTDPGFVERLRESLDRSEVPFKRLEALRVQLAKHELPGKKNSHALSPGYSRIGDAGICWEVSLGEREVEIVSRQEIAEQCRRFAADSETIILPRRIQDLIKPFPLVSYGVKRVIVVLSDGTELEAFVAWNRQLLNIKGIPAASVVDARMPA